ELKHPLSVKANKFSAAAKAKIESAGGQVEEVGHAAKGV
ncbi:uL15 family ribosomal protein, partial [Bacteroidota bacterium]